MLAVAVTAVPAPAPKEPAGEDIEAAEAAFLAEMNSQANEAGGGFAVEGEGGMEAAGTLVAAPAALPAAADVAPAGPLPTLEEAMQRLSPALRDVLEDLFRAKFTGVKRVPESAIDASPAA